MKLSKIENIISAGFWVSSSIVLILVLSFILYTVYLNHFEASESVYNTPFGKIDIDTAEVAMIDGTDRPPHISYLIHKEIVQKADSMLKVRAGDTVWYCFTPHTIKYYMIRQDSLGSYEVWKWDKYSNVSWPNVTTQFNQKYIFVK